MTANADSPKEAVIAFMCELAETEIVSIDSTSCSMMWQVRVHTCAAQPVGRLFFSSAMRVRTILREHPCRSKLGHGFLSQPVYRAGDGTQ
jgi:hypothetical protein